MRNQWLNFYTGSVEVKVYGLHIERFLNDLVEKRVKIWNMKRMGEQHIVFSIPLHDVGKMRVILRKYDCKVKFLKRSGVPFLTRRLIRNSGFLVGFFVFLICLFLLSNVVWNIEVTGAKPETEHAIRKELAKMGVEKGKFQFFMEDSDAIQRILSQEIDEITWVGVELKGTSYHLQVVEKKEPKKAKVYDIQNLVANKKAIIRKVLVEQGKAKVNVNEYVHKGQLLVSSNIGKDEKSVHVPAKGIVLGEIWYKSNVEIPLETQFSVLTGKELMKHYITINQFSIPIWGFSKNPYKNYGKEVTKKPFYFLGWKLPISYKSVTYRDKEEVVREYSKKEAIEKGLEVAKSDLKKILPKNSDIVGEKVLHERIENGKVILSIHYQVLENIAIERPIIQGD
ncbi:MULTISPECIES: sporulation protein YqfD [Bacillus]|uniref:sporulation protein YqfD n=1 Tax=Bacillus TaxID=1386 RepID=UPI0004783375|nr:MULTISPECIES: sporulation protein YqfD [Bacillus]